jgi:hypothetical protein
MIAFIGVMGFGGILFILFLIISVWEIKRNRRLFRSPNSKSTSEEK